MLNAQSLQQIPSTLSLSDSAMSPSRASPAAGNSTNPSPAPDRNNAINTPTSPSPNNQQQQPGGVTPPFKCTLSSDDDENDKNANDDDSDTEGSGFDFIDNKPASIHAYTVSSNRDGSRFVVGHDDGVTVWSLPSPVTSYHSQRQVEQAKMMIKHGRDSQAFQNAGKAPKFTISIKQLYGKQFHNELGGRGFVHCADILKRTEYMVIGCRVRIGGKDEEELFVVNGREVQQRLFARLRADGAVTLKEVHIEQDRILALCATTFHILDISGRQLMKINTAALAPPPGVSSIVDSVVEGAVTAGRSIASAGNALLGWFTGGSKAGVDHQQQPGTPSKEQQQVAAESAALFRSPGANDPRRPEYLLNPLQCSILSVLLLSENVHHRRQELPGTPASSSPQTSTATDNNFNSNAAASSSSSPTSTHSSARDPNSIANPSQPDLIVSQVRCARNSNEDFTELDISSVCAIPATALGGFRIIDWRSGKTISEVTGCHSAHLSALSLAVGSPAGSVRLLAVTASVRGTTCRVWNALTGTMLRQLEMTAPLPNMNAPSTFRLRGCVVDGFARVILMCHDSTAVAQAHGTASATHELQAVFFDLDHHEDRKNGIAPVAGEHAQDERSRAEKAATSGVGAVAGSAAQKRIFGTAQPKSRRLVRLRASSQAHQLQRGFVEELCAATCLSNLQSLQSVASHGSSFAASSTAESSSSSSIPGVDTMTVLVPRVHSSGVRSIAQLTFHGLPREPTVLGAANRGRLGEEVRHVKERFGASQEDLILD